MKLLILALSDFNEDIRQDLENELYWIQKFYSTKAKLVDLDTVFEELEEHFDFYFPGAVIKDGGILVDLRKVKDAIRESFEIRGY
ncbi:hypothetical protein [Pyrococcus kukulkanii]|uniref:hypothetical protein n=1 Tax=Pyrococcus kukulkanii TaxID=1609559 RepID=UPI003569492F